MTKKDIKYAFVPFIRGSAEKRLRNKEIPGTGLGLYICDYFVKQMNGTISIQSTLWQGTTVTLTFLKA